MIGYYVMTLLSVAIILVALRLVSKRHRCEKVTNLALFMLAFMCAIDWQVIGDMDHQVKVFWTIALIIAGGVLVYDASSPKTYYYLKDFQVRSDEHRLALERALRSFAETELPPGASVHMDYRLITMENVPPQQTKACLKLINDYIDEHDCSDIKDWRMMILIAATLQLIAVLAMLIYHLFNG